MLRTTTTIIISAAVTAAVALLGCGSAGAENDDTQASAATVATVCTDYVAPTDTASCHACSGSECQANGCRGNYYCNTSSNKCVAALPAACDGPAIISFFDTPSADGLGPVIDAINGANTSIRMEMFHLTVTPVADALVAAAKRGVTVEIIIDQDNWNSHTTAALKNELAAGGVTVTPSSTAFRITHEKSFVVDETTAYIMSLNLTSPYVDTRDYAVVTNDTGIVQEFLAVFAADLTNAKNGTALTPTLSDPNLAWSPVNSEDRLVAFVNAAEKTLVVSSENLGDAPIQAAMIAAAARGVDVRVLAPLCDQNVNPTYDLPFLTQLNEGGVTARAMPGAAPTPEAPYEHAKMMIADGTHAFIGSVNFSTASTTDARELGIFFQDAKAIQMISQDFESDWAQGVAPPKASAANCVAPITPTGT